MLEGFKTSLSHINKLMWAILSIAATLSVLNPSVDKANILSLTFDYSSLVYIAPFFIVGILLIRQIVIRNMVEIIRVSESKSKLRELVQSYPLMEFIRWRAPSGIETTLLTIFQTLVELFPAGAIMAFNNTHLQTKGIAQSIIYISPLVIISLSIWNYFTLRYHVYEPLCGSIKTPD